MQYFITGKLSRKHEVLGLPHAEFVQLVQTKVVPSLKILAGENPHGKVLAGGVPAGSRNLVMIVDLRGQDSHRCVRSFLTSLPMFEYYDWEVTPLETLEELVQAFGG
jgi:hypothetical protein